MASALDLARALQSQGPGWPVSSASPDTADFAAALKPNPFAVDPTQAALSRASSRARNWDVLPTDDYARQQATARQGPLDAGKVINAAGVALQAPARGIVSGFGNMLNLPNDPGFQAWAGLGVPETQTDSSARGLGADVAGKSLAAALNVAVPSMAVERPAGSLGMFGGVKAKTADLGALAKAQELAANGVDPAEVWKGTGWFQGADQKWRFEIPDENAQLIKSTAAMTSGVSHPLSDVLNHPELYQAYPELQGTRIATTTHYRPGEGAAVDLPSGRAIVVGADPRRVTDSDVGALSTGLHEAQHVVQGSEGLGEGGSPTFGHSRSDIEAAARQAYENDTASHDEDMGLLRELGFDTADIPKKTKSWDSLTPREQLAWYDRGRSFLYHRLAGEVEARNVVSRMNMTPEERAAKPPWETEDVPRDQQIVRFGK